MRALGNIVTGSDEQTDVVLAAGALPLVGQLLAHARYVVCFKLRISVDYTFEFRSNVVKEAAWTISNVTAGNPEQIQLVIEANILPTLVEVLIRVLTVKKSIFRKLRL